MYPSQCDNVYKFPSLIYVNAVKSVSLVLTLSLITLVRAGDLQTIQWHRAAEVWTVCGKAVLWKHSLEYYLTGWHWYARWVDTSYIYAYRGRLVKLTYTWTYMVLQYCKHGVSGRWPHYNDYCRAHSVVSKIPHAWAGSEYVCMMNTDAPVVNLHTNILDRALRWMQFMIPPDNSFNRCTFHVF